MKSARVSDMKPEHRVAIFVSLVRAEYAISYMSGALSFFYDAIDGYGHLLKQNVKRRYNALQKAIDGYHDYIKSQCVTADEDAEMILDCSVTFGQMMKESVKYLEHLNARLLLKSGYGHQELLTRLSVAHILMDTTAFTIGATAMRYPVILGLRTLGGQVPIHYGSCCPPHCKPTSFAALHKMLCEFNMEVLRSLGYDGGVQYDMAEGSEEYRIFENVQSMLAERFCDNQAICALSKGISGMEAVAESKRMSQNADRREANRNFKNEKI